MIGKTGYRGIGRNRPVLPVFPNFHLLFIILRKNHSNSLIYDYLMTVCIIEYRFSKFSTETDISIVQPFLGAPVGNFHDALRTGHPFDLEAEQRCDVLDLAVIFIAAQASVQFDDLGIVHALEHELRLLDLAGLA